MARYRVLAWRDIPTQVQVTDDAGGGVNRKMAPWFMQEISRISMREGLAATDDYLDAFDWSEWTDREGSAEAAADAVETELAAALGRKPDGHPLRGPGEPG
jgi:hypothetical protein